MNRPEFAHARYGRQQRRHHADGPPARGRGGLISSLAAIVILAVWAGGATLYILFKDDALKILIERQVAITRSYETQAAQLQTEIDRLRSLKLIDQERVDRAIADLARRQNAVEARQSALSGLAAEALPVDAAPAVTGSVPPAERAPTPRPAGKPSPLSDTILIAPATERQAQLQSRPLPPLGSELEARGTETATEAHLANLSRDLRRFETTQSDTLNQMEVATDDRGRRMRKVLDELGVHRVTASRAAHASAMASGGPFLPWSRPVTDPFARQIQRVRATSIAVKALEREISTIPVRRPTIGEPEVTSSYGVRIDPFLRQPAMHTGVDFRGETGDPVLASANGEVVLAERHGGYGLMVEIDHGNGLSSRYAHLSAIAVTVGTKLKAGDVVGRVGSTGRSTGPHLHYEIRMQGDVTDPQRFLRAGLRLREPG
jgi:murein DD-endopeptidase MepM/ murein hydrolase activator NlpD